MEIPWFSLICPLYMPAQIQLTKWPPWLIYVPFACTDISSLRAIKNLLPENIQYGDIKLTIAILAVKTGFVRPRKSSVTSPTTPASSPVLAHSSTTLVSSMVCHWFLPSSRVQKLWLAGPKIALCFHVWLFVCLYLSHVQQLRHVHGCHATWLQSTMSSVEYLGIKTAQLQVWGMEKQRQHRCKDTRLTKSGNARSKQLLVMPTEPLTNWEWLPGELLSGSQCSKTPVLFR